MRGTVVAPQPEAVDAGAEMLRAGGNAVDAAVCCALVQSVVDPVMCGIAGFGTMLIWAPGRDAVSIGFHATSGSLSTPDMWAHLMLGEAKEGYTHRLAGDVNELGYQAVATPGTLEGLAVALERYGRKSFADVVEAATRWARAGFAVRPFMHSAWLHDEDAAVTLPLARKLNHTATGRQLFYRQDGSLKRPGDLIRNEDYARTLEGLAERGPRDFYRGNLAATVARDLARGGSLVTAADLEGYAAEISAPLRGSYRGFDVMTAPLPAGGVHLIMMLNAIAQSDLKALEHNSPDYIERVTAVMAVAQAVRRRWLGDPRFVSVPVENLLSPQYAAELAQITRDRPRDAIEAPSAPEYPHTTQVCAADADGMIVSMTHSLGTPSGVITDGLGFMYNGSMSVFDPRPGTPGSIAPGRRRYTGMAPTIVMKQGKPLMAVGAPGGAHITNAIFQAILNVLDFDMTMAEAVSAPRFSVSGGAIHVSNRIPWRTSRELEHRGHRVVRSYQSYAFAGVHGLLLGSDGRWRGGADPQRDGMPLEV
jgi:gamma-glutamyltranspeptidase/glutathione hydrolase